MQIESSSWVTDADRKSRERDHYDHRSGDVDDPAYDWTSGSAGFRPPALRSPYCYLENWLAQRCRGKTLLDFGCGHGRFCVYPARLGATVTGVDISPNAIGFARKRATRERVGAATQFCVADCESLPFSSGSFDLVMSCGTLSCLDLGTGLREIGRVLRPGGQAIIVDTLGHNPLLNARRAWSTRRGLRTAWTRDHILKFRDLELFSSQFGACEIHFFDLLTVLLAAFTEGFQSRVIGPLARLDRELLRHRYLTRLAFKVVIELSVPGRAPAL